MSTADRFGMLKTVGEGAGQENEVESERDFFPRPVS